MNAGRLNYGIVFSGGGAKGAYQTGVWKRLNELGFDKEIVGVSGTSIGAMNSMLFAQGDYKIAEEAWKQTKESDIKAWNSSALLYVGFHAVSYAGTLLTTEYEEANPFLSPAVPTVTDSAAFTDSLFSLFKNVSLYTPERLRDIIHRYTSPEGIAATDKQVFTALTALEKQTPRESESAMTINPFYSDCPISTKIEYRSWAGLTYEEIVETVLASAAYPIAYPASAQKGKLYIDGGVLDNAPVKPLRDAGYRNIIVVHLEYVPDMKEREKKEERLNAQGGGWSRIMHIWPSAPVGKTFEISDEWTRQRINLGYMDTARQLLPILEAKHPGLEHLKDAQKHCDLAGEIYKRFVQGAGQRCTADIFRNFLKTEAGLTMMRNYEYAASLGYEPAKEITAEIDRIQKENKPN